MKFLSRSLLTPLLFLLCFTVYSQDISTLYYGHAGYTGKINNEPGVENQSGFNTGGFDLFVLSNVTDKLSALGEFFIGFKGDGPTYVPFNIERLFFKYRFSQGFNVRIGRQYTPLGYWNNQYTQAIVYQPTINRPYPIRNQNDKGILLTNSVGLQIDGEDLGPLQFSYYLMIDNTSGAPSINTDAGTQKAITAKLKIEPVLDFEVFASARFDHVEAGANSIQGITQDNAVDQSIFNVGVAYMTITSPFELIAEYLMVTNDVETVGDATNHFFYGYTGYRIQKITPYVQLGLLNYDDQDVYFRQSVNTGLAVGTRYNFNPKSVVKFEYKIRERENVERQDVFSVQVAAQF